MFSGLNTSRSRTGCRSSADAWSGCTLGPLRRLNFLSVDYGANRIRNRAAGQSIVVEFENFCKQQVKCLLQGDPERSFLAIASVQCLR